MNSGAKRLLLLCITAVALLACRDRLAIISYNVENLFDDRSEGEEYPQFRGGKWTSRLYAQKLAAVGRVIKASFPRGPDLIALQEVENPRALAALQARHLSGMGYLYAVIVPQAGVATNTAILSRIPILRARAHCVGSFAGVPLRHILEIELEHRGRRLVVFNNHWKARSEGAERTAAARLRAAEVLARRIRELAAADPATDIVALGDFNENVEGFAADSTVALTRLPGQAGSRNGKVLLYDAWFELPSWQWGSCAYRGRWETPDHILLSAGLFDGAGFSYKTGGFRVMREGFLLTGPQGFPKRWRGGESRSADPGYSDHLPLLISLEAGSPAEP